MEVLRPFGKWAGGKSSLISQLTSFFPLELKDGIINKYIDSNTFVYFASPYRPLSITSGFTSFFIIL